MYTVFLLCVIQCNATTCIHNTIYEKYYSGSLSSITSPIVISCPQSHHLLSFLVPNHITYCHSLSPITSPIVILCSQIRGVLSATFLPSTQYELLPFPLFSMLFKLQTHLLGSVSLVQTAFLRYTFIILRQEANLNSRNVYA